MLKPSTLDLLKRMIAFRPVSADLAAVNQLADFVSQYLQEAGVHTEVLDHEGRRGLYAATRPERQTDVLFNAHLDVVPGNDQQFEPRLEGDWLVGRGTHDCLGNAAMLIHLLIRFRDRASIGAIFTTDEEIGGETTRAMVERGYRGRRLILVVDGSGYSIVVAQKGMLVVRLRATGLGCHAAEPWKGKNAIDLLIDGYQRIRNLFPTVTPPDEWHNTLAPTVLAAGNVHNRIPDQAEMTLNIRLTEGTDADAIQDQLAALSGLSVVREMACPPAFTDPDHPELRALAEHMAAHLGREIAIKRSNGATDARHFVELGVPIAIIGVPGRDLHGDNEALDLTALADYEEMLAAYIGDD